MTPKFLYAVVVAAVLGSGLTGCVSSRKIYQPPSNAKVTASTQKVKSDIATAHQSARTAKTHVTDAQKSADKISVLSLNVQQKLDLIIKAAPPDLQPALMAVKVDVTAMQDEEATQHASLDKAQKTQDGLEKQLTDLETHETDLEAQQKSYYANAQTLADSATSERANLIKTQKALLASRFSGILFKLGAILFVFIVIAIIILKITGKLALKLSG